MTNVSASVGIAANGADAPVESFPCLTTRRLRLREIVPTDAIALFAIHGDREAMRWFGNDPIASPVEAEQMVKVFAGLRKPPAMGIRWGLERDQDGKFSDSTFWFTGHS